MKSSATKIMTNALLATSLLVLPTVGMAATTIIANGNYLTSTVGAGATPDDIYVDGATIDKVANAPVVTMDSPNKSLFLTFKTPAPFSIINSTATNGADNAAVLYNGGNSGNITLGANSAISATLNNAIKLKDNGATTTTFGTIDNSGSIAVSAVAPAAINAIYVETPFVSITNQIAGIIQGGANAERAIRISKNTLDVSGNINNAGLITATTSALDAIYANTPLIGSITNSGTITTSSASVAPFASAINMSDVTGGITNTNIISQASAAGGSAISLQGSSAITNDGINAIISNLSVALPAISATKDLSITNTLGAQITSPNIAIKIFSATTNQAGTITNAGKIEGSLGGILISELATFTGSINNTGLIKATAAGARSIDINAALTGGIINKIDATNPNNIVRGVIQSVLGRGINITKGRTDITNDADIKGGLEAAVFVGANADSDITNSTTGVIAGTVAGVSGIRFDVGLHKSIITNSGAITGFTTGDAIRLGGSTITGSITNSTKTGIISSVNGFAINAAGGITGGINNQKGAQIVSTANNGIVISVGRTNITNAGTISGAGASLGAIDIFFDTDITNTVDGVIKGTNGDSFGLFYDSSVPNINSIVLNQGLIQSNNAGNAIDIRTKVTGTLTNSGTISSQTVDNGNGISISGANPAVGFTGGLINKTGGTIQGKKSIEISATYNTVPANRNKMNITNEVGAFITSSESTGNAFGIDIIPASVGTVGGITNFGTIQTTTQGTAIRVDGGPMDGQIWNKSTGVISVLTDPLLFSTAINAVQNVGVGFTNGGIINEGKIDAGNTGGTAIGIGPTATTWIVNTGTIIGKVVLGVGASKLDLNPRSVFTGSISAPAGVGNGTVNVNPGAGNILTLGTGIDAFALNNVAKLNVLTGTLILNKAANNLNEVNLSNNTGIEINANLNTVGGNQLFTVNDNATVKVSTNVIMNTDYIFKNSLAINGVGQHIVVIKDKTVGNFGSVDMVGRNLTTTNITKMKLVLGDGYIATGDTFDIFTNINKLVDKSTLTGPNSATIAFSRSVVPLPGGQTIRLTAVRNPLTNLVTPDVLNLAQALEGIGLNLDGSNLNIPFAQVLGQLSTLGDPFDVNLAVQMLADDVNGAKRIPVHSANLEQLKLLSDRLSLVRAERDIKESGYTAGSYSDYNTLIWGQLMGGYAKQRPRNFVAGYEMDSYGFMFGSDALMIDDLTMGIAFGYSYSDVSVDNVGKNTGRIRSIQGNVYGTYQMPNSYVEGMFSIGADRYRSIRNIVIGTLRQESRADFDGRQFGFRIGSGWPLMRGHWQFTPQALVEFSRILQGTYGETGAGPISLLVEPQSNSMMNVGGGLRASLPQQNKFGTFNMEVQAVVKHDVFGTRQTSYARFVGGGPKFVTLGPRPAKTGLFLGAAGTVVAKNKFSYVFNYELELRPQYVHNTAFFTLRYEL